MMREAGGESEKFSSCVDDGLVVSQVGHFKRMMMIFSMILFGCSFNCLAGCLMHMFACFYISLQYFLHVSTMRILIAMILMVMMMRTSMKSVMRLLAGILPAQFIQEGRSPTK